MSISALIFLKCNCPWIWNLIWPSVHVFQNVFKIYSEQIEWILILISFINLNIILIFSGPDAWPKCHPGWISGSSRKPSSVWQQHPPGLPLCKDQGLPLHHPAAADSGHRSCHADQGPPEDHHRGGCSRKSFRGRSQHQIHLLLGQAQRVQTGKHGNILIRYSYKFKNRFYYFLV